MGRERRIADHRRQDMYLEERKARHEAIYTRLNQLEEGFSHSAQAALRSAVATLRALVIVLASLLLFLGLFLGYLTIPLLVLTAFVLLYAAFSLLKQRRRQDKGKRGRKDE